LHPVGGQLDANFIQPDANFNQPDANFIQLAANRMQISFSRPPAGCKLHPASGYTKKYPNLSIVLHAAGDQPNEICIRLATNWMQNFAKIRS
jgi:hypothetical protein